jgi:hypothetical protein
MPFQKKVIPLSIFIGNRNILPNRKFVLVKENESTIKLYWHEMPLCPSLHSYNHFYVVFGKLF